VTDHGETKSYLFFKTSTIARYVKIVPTEWNNHPSMRVAVLYSDSPNDWSDNSAHASNYCGSKNSDCPTKQNDLIPYSNKAIMVYQSSEKLDRHMVFATNSGPITEI
jgi:hypothetical protein